MSQTYKITASKIKKILSPFDTNYTEYAFTTFNKKTIEKSWGGIPEKNKDFNGKKDPLELFRKIRLLLINPDDISKCVFDFNKSAEESFLIENPEHMYAAIFLNKDIEVEVKGDISLMTTLFGKLKLSEEVKEFSEDDFDWEINQKLLNDTWGNEDFILNKIKYKENEEVKSILLGMSKELWCNKGFMEKLLQNEGFKNLERKEGFRFIPKDILCSVGFIEFFKDSYKFKDLLVSYYFNFYIENKDEENNEVVKYLKENVFNNPEILKNISWILNHNDDFYGTMLKKVCECFDNKLINNSDFVKSIDKNRICLYPYLTEDFFKNKENLELFLTKADDWYNYAYKDILSDYSKVFNNIINDKDNLIEYTEKYNFGKAIVLIYKGLSKELKEDVDITTRFILKHHDIFNEIPKKIRYKPEHIRALVNKKGDLTQVPANFIFDLMVEDKELFYDICSLDSSYLESEHCLLEIKKDIKFFALIPPCYVNQKEVAEMCNSVEDAIVLVKKNKEFYLKLPFEFSKQKEVVFTYINELDFKSGWSDNKFYNIPEEVRLNKSFCLDLLSVDISFYRFIPGVFLMNKKFILDIFKRIDDKKIDSAIIEKFPLKIRQFIDSVNTSSGYYDFFKTYFQKLDMEYNLNTEFKQKKLKM